MRNVGNEKWESELKVLSDFFESDTEKIYLVIGREEAGLYSLANESLAAASREKNNQVVSLRDVGGRAFQAFSLPMAARHRVRARVPGIRFME